MLEQKAAIIIPPLLAATESTFQGVKSGALGELLVQGAALLAIIILAWGLIDRVRGGAKQKREVSFADEFATRKEHQDLKAEVAKIDNERRVSVAKLHDKVDANTAITGKIEGKVDMVIVQLTQLNNHNLRK